MTKKKPSPNHAKEIQKQETAKKPPTPEKEFGGFENREEPTKHGDWNVNGRCSDF